MSTTLRRKTILIILDGFGVNPSKKYNAVYEANTPRLDNYFGRYPHTTLQASGRAVGLPDGQMGNSEVGHITLGCGTILKQDLVRIDDAIEAGGLWDDFAFQELLHQARESKRPLHLLGLLSDGGVHSHINHLFAIMRFCHQAGVVPAIHAITDGRDTAPQSAKGFIERLMPVLAETKGVLSSVTGRFYAMDRDQRWERVKVAFDGMVHGVGVAVSDGFAAIDSAYTAGENDEFIKPRIIAGAELIQSGDPVLFYNFRNDRPRELSEALALPHFSHFERGTFQPVLLTTITRYSVDLPATVIFPPQSANTNLAKIISEAGLKQFHCAETEKYAHVTFFFNSGREQPYAGEERLVIPSPKVETYDLKPEMSAKEVADAVINAIKSAEYAFIVVNFANGDMVGHTAVREAVIQAVETLDREVGRVLDAAVAHDYSVLLTADHGNCDEYFDAINHVPNTQHTVYPVPLLVIDKVNWRLSTSGGLSNIAPTVLQLMGLAQPSGMEGKSLLLEGGAVLGY